jgi:hypothetical protein
LTGAAAGGNPREVISDQLSRPCPWYRDRGLIASTAFSVAVLAYNLTQDQLSEQVHGVLAASPMLAAVLVERVSRVAWATVVAVLAAVIGTMPAHANWDTSQNLRLGSILLTGVVGWFAADVRLRNQRRLVATREVAKTAQRAVMRMTPPQAQGVDAAVRYVSASEAANIGGDAYEALLTPFGLRVLVADARGKGLPAVLSSAVALGAFREWAYEERELTDLIDRMDASVTREVADEDFVTALVAEFSGNRLTYVAAGHPAPVLLRDGRARSLDVQPSPPLSLISEGKRPVLGAVLLRRGDVLLMFTDGLADARNEMGEFFGVGEALERVAKDAQSVDECADGLLAELRDYIHSDLEDDVAMVALRVTDPVERLTEQSLDSAAGRP